MKLTIPLLGLTSHGGNRVLIAVANELARREHDVELLIPRGRNENFYTLYPGITVKEIGFKIRPKRISYIVFLFLSFFHFKDRIVLANYFLTVIPCYLSSQIYKTKYIYFVQDIEYRFFSGFLKTFFKYICEWTFRKGNIVTANTYLYSIIAPFWKIDLPVNIGPSQIFFSQPRLGSEKEFDVIYFLRPERHKRLDRFDDFLELASGKIKIACITQDSELFLKYRAKVQSVFKPKDDVELIKVLDRCRIFLLTSDHEGFSLPPLEGMARGLPPVLFNCGGPSVYCVNFNNSIIIEEGGGVQKVFHAVKNILQNPSLLEELSMNAKATSGRFSLDEAVKSICDYIEL
jgi:glycosyltransferase involved in cell wall biosynthesis